MPPEVKDALVKAVESQREERQEIHLASVCVLARGIFLEKKLAHLLSDNEGLWKLSPSWASSWLSAHGYVVRKGTQAKEKKLLTAEVHNDYLQRIALFVKVCNCIVFYC